MANNDELINAEKPWYEGGLRFACTGCGNCCTGGPGYVWVKNEEVAAIAAFLGISHQDCERQYVRSVGVRKSLVELPNFDCVFLDGATRKCTIYAVRPRQCRTWPFWQSNLRTPEAWAHTCRVCPGSGAGKLYSLEQIETQAAVIKL
jgi:Fe-S-cluster containining protein